VPPAAGIFSAFGLLLPIYYGPTYAAVLRKVKGNGPLVSELVNYFSRIIETGIVDEYKVVNIVRNGLQERSEILLNVVAWHHDGYAKPMLRHLLQLLLEFAFAGWEHFLIPTTV